MTMQAECGVCRELVPDITIAYVGDVARCTNCMSDEILRLRVTVASLKKHRVERDELIDEIACLEQEVERLRETLDEITERHVRVMEERCPTDERHCTCVPMLRGEIERLQLENNKLHTECGHLQADLAECRRLLQEGIGNPVDWIDWIQRAAKAAGGGDGT